MRTNTFYYLTTGLYADALHVIFVCVFSENHTRRRLSLCYAQLLLSHTVENAPRSRSILYMYISYCTPRTMLLCCVCMPGTCACVRARWYACISACVHGTHNTYIHIYIKRGEFKVRYVVVGFHLLAIHTKHPFEYRTFNVYRDRGGKKKSNVENRETKMRDN